MTQDIDQLAINTIRTLSIDAVQKANSGHPGTPMSMAPVAYELWQNHLRYDPADPIWPNRDRFVLSAGHASMLLYSMLFLAGVQRVDADYDVARRARLLAARDRKLPPAALAHPGPPRVPLDLRGRDDDRAARPGHRDLGRDGDRLEVAGRALRRRPLRLRRLRAGRRRLPDGGRLARVGLARRSPQARQPLLALRQQPHHDRRRHRPRLRRRRADPLRGLRLERAAGRRRQRPRPARARLRGVQGRDRPPDPDRRRQPHRLGLAEQAGHRVRPRRTARRGGGQADQARLRLARGRPVPRPRRGPRALRRGDRQARRRAAAPPGSRSSSRPAESRRGDRDRDDAAPRAAGRLGRRASPPSRPTKRRAWPPARPRTRSRTRSPSGCRG